MELTVAKVIGTMFTAFGQEGAVNRLSLYCAFFKNHDLHILQLVCKKIWQTSKFVPTIAEIEEQYQNVLLTARPDLKGKSWDEAWEEIQKKLFSTGPYQVPRWSTEEIARVVKSIGWRTLCETPSEQMSFLRAQMRDMYNAICKRKADDILNRKIIGNKMGYVTAIASGMDMKKLGGTNVQQLESGTN